MKPGLSFKSCFRQLRQRKVAKSTMYSKRHYFFSGNPSKKGIESPGLGRCYPKRTRKNFLSVNKHIHLPAFVVGFDYACGLIALLFKQHGTIKLTSLQKCQRSNRKYLSTWPVKRGKCNLQGTDM